MSYGNRIGVTARADRLADLTGLLADRGLSVDAWYGVRVFTDTVPSDTPAPAEEELRVLLDCEERAGSTDPYRGVAALVHVIARRVLAAIAGRAAICQMTRSALPGGAGFFGRPGPGPARLAFTLRRRGCPPGRPSARRGGAPGLSTASSSAPRSRRRGRSSRLRGRC
jgi:hypothetical protein